MTVLKSIVAVLLIVGSSSMIIQISTDPTCLALPLSPASPSSLYYVASGVAEVNCSITNAENQQVLSTISGIDKSYRAEGGHGQIIACWAADTDGQLNFDWYDEGDSIRKAIDKGDIKLVETTLKQTYDAMQAISRNQQFHIQRDQSHKQHLQDSQARIKWTGIIKIIFLLTSALLQLWIMKGFFKGNSGNAYQPVQMT